LRVKVFSVLAHLDDVFIECYLFVTIWDLVHRTIEDEDYAMGLLAKRVSRGAL
jgi:hypothetical protein